MHVSIYMNAQRFDLESSTDSLANDVRRLIAETGLPMESVIIEAGDGPVLDVDELASYLTEHAGAPVFVHAKAGGGGITWTEVLEGLDFLTASITLGTAVASAVAYLRRRFRALPVEGAWDVTTTVLGQRTWTAQGLAEHLQIPRDQARKALRAFGYEYDRHTATYRLAPYKPSLGNVLLTRKLGQFGVRPRD